MNFDAIIIKRTKLHNSCSSIAIEPSAAPRPYNRICNGYSTKS